MSGLGLDCATAQRSRCASGLMLKLLSGLVACERVMKSTPLLMGSNSKQVFNPRKEHPSLAGMCIKFNMRWVNLFFFFWENKGERTELKKKDIFTLFSVCYIIISSNVTSSKLNYHGGFLR